jgi:hypothetical protein
MWKTLAFATVATVLVACTAETDDADEGVASTEQAQTKRQCRGAASPIKCPCDGSLVQLPAGYKWWDGSQCVVTLQNGDPVASAPRIGGGGGKVYQQ